MLMSLPSRLLISVGRRRVFQSFNMVTAELSFQSTPQVDVFNLVPYNCAITNIYLSAMWFGVVPSVEIKQTRV